MSQKLALIIGTSEYQDTTLPKLQTPDVDVEALAKVLRDQQVGGFDEVIPLINQSVATLNRAIARFFMRRKRDDLLLLYFTGHGLLDDQGQLYLAAQDTERDLLSATAVSAAFISREIDRSRSQRQVLILDCCYSGAFARGSKGVPGAQVGTKSAFEGSGYGRVVLTASDETQFAWEGQQVIGGIEKSVFTHYLVEGLQTGEADEDRDGWVTLDEWYDYVYGKVVSQTSKQTPGKWNYEQRGDLIIARNPNPVVKQAQLPAELQDVLTINKPIQLELVRIPAGEFLMGSDPEIDKDAQKNEQPQHTVSLPDYYIAKTPVTNAQYAAFVQATGHSKPNHWKRGKIPKGKAEHPIAYISWADAAAFCQWLSRETGQTVRLPTEAEWEKAARGTDGRLYPWGNERDKTKLNSYEGGVRDTTPVGRYSPQGDSPYGVADMAGNVWEWCATKYDQSYKSYPYDTAEDEWSADYLAEPGFRVLRGGSWNNNLHDARCADRYRYSNWSDLIGCRVLVSPSG
jgi:formylglycine-generating enzyme required for sulfatase activity